MTPAGLLNALTRVGGVVLLAVLLYVGLVQADVLRSPFDPVVRGDVALARGNAPGLRVLFVGNSFTSWNGMPELVGDLAALDRGAERLFAVGYTAGGRQLSDAADDDELGRLLAEVRWDVVVLQEQSALLSFPRAQRLAETHPFARTLDRRIDRGGARTMLFMTWGYRDGDRANVAGDTYNEMQTRLANGYYELAEELDAAVAPVGAAWAAAVHDRPGLHLWAHDGRHPGRRGSYLAACVFYAALTGRDPAASTFTGGLPRGEAAFLQRIATQAVANRQ